MTRAEREMMIGRYMSGGMSSAEEQEFFIQVAVDPELRLDLKAHRTVESAMRKDRDAEPAGHTALRGRIAGTLAAYPPNPGQSASPVLPPGSPASALVQTGGGIALAKWLGAAVVVIATAVGGVMLLPSAEEKAEAPATSIGSPPAVTPRQQLPSDSPAPAGVTTSAPSVTERGSKERVTAGEERPARRDLIDRTTDRTAERPGSVRPASREQSGAPDAAVQRPVRSKHSLPDIDAAATKRSSGDSIPVGITIVLPKK
jgi:hypothetical protein